MLQNFIGLLVHYRKIIEEKRKELEADLSIKLKNSKLPCKICAAQIVAEKLPEHSTNCREKNELNRKIANMNSKINNDIFEALQTSRGLSTNNVIAMYDFYCFIYP